MNEEIQELIKLLYNNNISQSGKRKLEKYIKEMQKEIENKTDDFTTVYMQGFYDGKNKMKDKIKEMIQEYKKRLDIEESNFDKNDIENRKACQYARAKLTFLLEDIYKLNNMKVKKYNQILEKTEMTKEEAINIIDEMYRDKIKELKEKLNNERMLNKSALETLKECVHKEKILEKLEEIRKEYNNIISNDNVSLDYKNINSHRYDAMSQVLEELLKGI